MRQTGLVPLDSIYKGISSCPAGRGDEADPTLLGEKGTGTVRCLDRIKKDVVRLLDKGVPASLPMVQTGWLRPQSGYGNGGDILRRNRLALKDC